MPRGKNKKGEAKKGERVREGRVVAGRSLMADIAGELFFVGMAYSLYLLYPLMSTDWSQYPQVMGQLPL